MPLSRTRRLFLRGNDPLSPSVSLLRPELRGLPHQSLAREGTVTGSAPPLPAAEAGVRAADRLPQGVHVETRAVTLRSDPRTHARFLYGMCLEQEFLTGMEFHAQRMKLFLKMKDKFTASLLRSRELSRKTDR